MEGLVVALPPLAAILFGGALIAGVVLIVGVRTERRERREMRQHVKRLAEPRI